MRKEIWNTISFLLLLVILIGAVTKLLKITDLSTLQNMRGFVYEEENDLDVVFLGQSEVYSAFIPTLAYEKQGFTSYNYGLAGMPGNMFPIALKEVLAHQKPKVLVIEITAFTKDEDYFERTATMHSYVDNLPLSKSRKDAIEKYVPTDAKQEFYRPVSTYHNNWKLLKKCFETDRLRVLHMFRKHSTMKGYATNTGVISKKKKKDEDFTFNETDQKYLEEVIAICKEAGLNQVLFARYPHERKVVDQTVMDKIKGIVEGSGYDFVNWNQAFKKTRLQKKNDFFDYDHMNIFGAQKFTDFLGEYLMNAYKLEPKHSEEITAMWNEDARIAQKMIDYAEKATKNQTHQYIYEYTREAKEIKPIQFKMK